MGLFLRKILISLLFLLGILCNQQNQFFLIKENTVFIKGQADEEGIFCGTGEIKETVFGNLIWKKIYLRVPEEWDVRFCDNLGCHWDFPDSINLKKFDKNSSRKERALKLIVNPNNQKGEGAAYLLVYKSEYPELIDTLYYYINIE